MPPRFALNERRSVPLTKGELIELLQADPHPLDTEIEIGFEYGSCRPILVVWNHGLRLDCKTPVIILDAGRGTSSMERS